MANLTTGQTTTILVALGWRIRSNAERVASVKRFQAGWNLGAALKADGIVGPKTSAAMLLSYARAKKGLGTASANFSFKEFQCKCGGKYSTCARIWSTRALMASLERYRALNGRTTIVSGCRCYGHNRAVGGASQSQHMYGSAADIAPQRSTAAVKALKTFAGIGYSQSSGRVRHVDRRDVSGHNTTKSSVTNPMTWPYSS